MLRLRFSVERPPDRYTAGTEALGVCRLSRSQMQAHIEGEKRAMTRESGRLGDGLGPGTGPISPGRAAETCGYGNRCRPNGSDAKLHGQGPRAEARAARGAPHVRRANARRVTPRDFDVSSRLGRRAEAGPCQLLRRVSPPFIDKNLWCSCRIHYVQRCRKRSRSLF